MKKYFEGMLTALMMVTFSICFISCGSDNNDEGVNLSETQIKQYLEAGEGIWQVVEYDDEDGSEYNFQTQFKEGKTSGYFNQWEPYTITGNRLYSISFDNGSIYFNKIDATSFEGKWNNRNQMVGKKVK